MEIIYTLNSVESEPGPNLYWRGRASEFLTLMINLHALGTSNGVRVALESIENIRLTGVDSYVMISSENGCTLAQVQDGAVLTELDPKLWREFLHNVLIISFTRGFIYQDISCPGLIEDANIIMSSEIW